MPPICKQTIAAFVLSLYIAFVFVQSLFFKFTGSEESIFIFATLRDWSGIGLFEPFGRWFIGFVGRHGFAPFAYYRILLGLAIMLAVQEASGSFSRAVVISFSRLIGWPVYSYLRPRFKVRFSRTFQSSWMK